MSVNVSPRLASAALVLIVLAPAAARAEMVSYSTPTGTAVLRPVLPQFDPSLGTLTRVDFTASGSVDLRTTLTGDPSVGVGRYTQRVDIGGVFPPIGSAPIASSVASISFQYPPFTSIFNLGGSYFTSPSFTGDLGRWVGTGQVALGLDYTITLTNPPRGVITGPTMASGIASVTYTYTPVPEPAGVLLLGAGLATLGAAAVAGRCCKSSI